MSDNVKSTEKVVEGKKAVNSPKTSRATWNEIKIRFETKNYTSLEELSREYSINPITLRTRMFREKWNDKQRTLQNKVEQVIERKALSLAERQGEYLERLVKRGEVYEKMLTASVSQMSTTNEGIPLCEPETLDVLSRSELRVKEMICTGLRVVPLSQVDLTSNGQSLGQSFVQAIAALRESQSTPKLSSQDLKAALEAEIIE